MAERKNTIGRFEIIEKIGEGPIGSVYKALDPVIRRTVAIKVIKLYALEESATFAEVFEKIYRVVRTSTSLNHPNICIIYDLSEEKKIPYITMEYVDGHDLDWMLQNKHQFKRSQILNILQQTCDALDFAHKKNVIHQDLKATNIILTPDLHVKITDFGIAGLDEIAAAQTKKLLSIPYYIAPEQALGEKVSPASDLFSLGAVIYQILSGQLPFPGASAANVIMMIARDNPAVPRDLEKSGIKTEDWNSFFGVALAKSPGQRFHTANEMFSALQKILPVSETSYFPYSVSGGGGDSTGKFDQKTYVGDSPTLLIDASKMLEEGIQLEDNNSSSPQAETISIPIPGYTSAPEVPAEFESTIAYDPEKQSAYELLDSAMPERESNAGSDKAAEVGATVIINKDEEFPDLSEDVTFKPTPPPVAVTQTVKPSPDSTQSRKASSELTGSQTGIPFKPAAEPPKQQTIPPKPRVEPTPVPPPAPPTPPPQKYQTVKPTPVEEFDELPATQMIPIPKADEEILIPPTQMISMPTQPPVSKTNPPAPAPSIPPVPPKQTIPSTPYSLPPSPKPTSAAPPGAKSALKIYWIAALAIAVVIVIVGLIILIPKLTSKKEVVTPTPEPKPPIVEPKPKPKPVVEPTVVATVGKITVNSEPPGATVSLNEVEKGITPVEVPDLPFGKYILKLRLKGYQDAQQEIELSEQVAELNVPITLEKAVPQAGTLIVDSNPTGAFIIIQNRAMGVTPKTLNNQKPGTMNITLKKDGFQDYSGSVKITAGKKATFSGQLQEVQKIVEKPREAPKPVEPDVKPGQLVQLSDKDVVRPRSMKKIFPKYPDAAKKLKLQGMVGLNVLVSETGQVLDVKVVSSINPILDQSAIDAARQWSFEPATKKGVKVKVWYPVNMNFQAR